MKRSMFRTAAVLLLMAGVYAAAATQAQKAPVEKPVKVADGVWFEQHNNIGKFGSNVSWIEFSDYVVMIDASFPAGAEEALRNVKASTNKPVRYVIVTHYHGDHSLGTGVFAKEGTTIVAHENARKEFLARNVEGYLKTAERDPVYAKYKPAPPELTFSDKFILDDGKRRLEVHHFGQAHTTGCIFAFLPKEKIVFTGDACVNGPFNYCGDSDTASWIDVLTQVQTLDPDVVVPAHGAVAKRDLLQTQKQYFIELRAQIAAMVRDGKTLAEVKAAADVPMWKQWTGEQKMSEENVSHVYRELTRGALNWATGDLNQPGRSAVAIPVKKGEPAPKLKFALTSATPEELAAYKLAAPNVEVVVPNGIQGLLEIAPGIHGCAGNLATNPQFLKAATNLRWVQQFSAGVEGVTFLPGVQGNDQIVLTNMRTMFAPPIADHVMGMLLSLTRSLPHYQSLMKDGTWGKGEQAPYQGELLGKTMLVVGLGGNGIESAKRAHAFGMKVIATDPKDMAVPHFVSRLEKPDKLNALLPAADVVVLAAPLTPDTQALFGTDRFALMKEGAFLINIARGKMVDTDALVAALKSKRLQGAGLDVTEPEPLPSDHPLWKMGNVIITPHVSGQSPGTKLRTRALFLENLKRFGAGEPLLNVVDKKAGY